MKRIIAWLCILTLLVTVVGCSKKRDEKIENEAIEGTNSAKQTDIVDNNNNTNVNDAVPIMGEGNYIESEFSLPEMEEGEYRIGSQLNHENQYVLYTAISSGDRITTNVYSYTLINNSFQKSSVDWIVNACQDLSLSAETVCQSEDGNDYIQCSKMIAVDEIYHSSCFLIKKTDDSKGYADITPTYWHEEKSGNSLIDGLSIFNIRVLKNEIVCYMEENSQLVFYDLKKDKIVDYGNNLTNEDYAVKENTIYFFEVDNNCIEVHDIAKDQTDYIDLSNTNINQSNRKLFVNPENEITILDKTGLHILNKDGTLWETIVDGDQCTMSVPSYRADSIVAVPGNSNIYVVIYESIIEDRDALFVKYEPSSEGVITYSKELKICSLYDNMSIREMIHMYRKNHPEVKISYEVMMDDGSSITKADAIKSLNVELLAGNGPDILLLDGLPLESYIEKGVLLDISDLFTINGQDSKVLKNIADCYTKDGKIYCMPMRLLLPLYASLEDISSYNSSTKDLATYCKDKNTRLIDTVNYNQLVKTFLANYSNEVFDQEGLINKEGLYSFLESLDIIAKQIGAGPEDAAESSDVYEYSGRFYEYYTGWIDKMMWNDHPMASMLFVSSTFDLESLVFKIQKMGGFYTSINQNFIPNGIIGINQMANEPELAKEFVSNSFDESIQSLDLYEGFPMNSNALANWQNPHEKSFAYYITQDNSVEYIFRERLTTEERQVFMNIMNSLTRPVYTDDTGSSIIVEGAIKYLMGDKTLEQSVNEIVRKMNLYLSE